jgi:uncharacterized membrane protein YphA (DoxX/SURF4 family)
MRIVRGIARRLVATWFIAEGVAVARRPETHVEAAAPLVERLSAVTPLPDSPTFLVRCAAGKLVAAGALIAFGIAPRLGGALAAAILAPAAVGGYPFWKERDPQRRLTQFQGFATRAALAGAGALIAADTSARDARRLAQARRRSARPA